MKSAGRSFEGRLMLQIQTAIPSITPYIELNSPDFPGLLVTICDPAIKQKIELRITDHELTKWEGTESELIRLIVNNLQQSYHKLKNAP